MLCRCGVGVAQQLPKLLGRVRISSFAFKSCNDGGGAMKGSKRNLWLKNGIKESKKLFKAQMNRRVRHSSNLCGTLRGSAYKKILGKAIFLYVP